MPGFQLKTWVYSELMLKSGLLICAQNCAVHIVICRRHNFLFSFNYSNFASLVLASLLHYSVYFRYLTFQALRRVRCSEILWRIKWIECVISSIFNFFILTGPEPFRVDRELAKANLFLRQVLKFPNLDFSVRKPVPQSDPQSACNAFR